MHHGRKCHILLHSQTKVSHIAEHTDLTDSVLQCSMESRSVFFIDRKCDLAVTGNSMIAHTCLHKRLDFLELLRCELAHIIASVTVCTVITVADFLCLIRTCKLLTHTDHFVLDVADSKEVSVTYRQRSFTGRIDSARKLHTSPSHNISHFQHKITVSRHIFLLRNVTIFCIADDVFLRWRIRSVGLCNVHIAKDFSQPIGILIIHRHTDSTVHFVGIIIDTRFFKHFLHTLKIRKLH